MLIIRYIREALCSGRPRNFTRFGQAVSSTRRREAKKRELLWFSKNTTDQSHSIETLFAISSLAKKTGKYSLNKERASSSPIDSNASARKSSIVIFPP